MIDFSLKDPFSHLHGRELNGFGVMVMQYTDNYEKVVKKMTTLVKYHRKTRSQALEEALEELRLTEKDFLKEDYETLLSWAQDTSY